MRKPLLTEKTLQTLYPALFCATRAPFSDALHELSQAHLPVTFAIVASETKKLVVMVV